MKRVSDVSGLQYPVLRQNLSFKTVEGDMVQILHSGGNHWMAVSTVGVKVTNVIRVYDSQGTTLTSDARKQVASLMKTRESSITVEYANVQVSYPCSEDLY